MRGIILGGLVGAVIAIGVVFLLNLFGVWVYLGTTGSMLGGGAIGSLFMMVGIMVGDYFDDSY